MLGRIDSLLPTSDVAYCIVLRIDQISDLKLREIVYSPACLF